MMKEQENFSSNDYLYVHQQNRYALHRVLARLNDYIEVQSGQPSLYVDYVVEGTNRFEVEHIWTNHKSSCLANLSLFNFPFIFGNLFGCSTYNL